MADAERVAKAEAEAAAMRDKYLRLQAEWDNYRKRTAEEAGEMRVRAAEKLMGDLLPVMDDFERAIAHAEANGDAGLLDGVKAISTKLSESLGKHGLETIDPAGEAFDALEHQAVGQVEDASVPDETVAPGIPEGLSPGQEGYSSGNGHHLHWRPEARSRKRRRRIVCIGKAGRSARLLCRNCTSE